MHLYNRMAQYAVAVASCLAEHYADGGGELLNSQKIADDRELPQAIVAKILTQLSREGIVAGVPGPNGGYRLARPPRQVSLMDVVSVFERTERLTMCPFGPRWCGTEDPCPLHDELVAMNESTDAFLRDTRLDVFAKK
jgi:Rrf2 family transcriptional regulator, iron-sulfur cluster assembly transcription factor